MCYSAAVKADFKAYRRLFPKARLDLKTFYDTYWRRKKPAKPPMRMTRAMEAWFADPQTDEEHAIKTMIEEFSAEQLQLLGEDLFKQRKRLADAQRALQTKQTKKALEDERIATNKIADGLAKLESLRRTDFRESDTRVFPLWYAPVLIIENGEPIVRPMRYLCRPQGMPASVDVDYPGIYNARRNSLRKFWRGQFGHTHGLAIVSTFWENVKLHDAEHRELRPDEKPKNIVLQFRPQPHEEMLVACLVSHWTPPSGSDEPDLWSFAAVTDEPPPEVAAAGHDRCIVPLRPENVNAWLNPEQHSLDELDALLEDKEHPYYEHRLAA